MKKTKHPVVSVALSVIFTFSAMLSVSTAYASDDTDTNAVRRYAIIITNIMHGHILAPPSVVAHNSNFKMFTLGGTASPGVAALAETPSGALFLSESAALPTVYSTAISSSVIPPGGTQTLYIETTKNFPEVTVATMLATTNDAFMAAHNVRFPRTGSVTVEAIAYDAGTEVNSTDCAYVFGPPCNDLRHNPATAEGFVHIHPGISVGSGGLDPTVLDWRNPVAQIEIKRVK